MGRTLRKTSWTYLETIFQRASNGTGPIQNKKSKIIENIFWKKSRTIFDRKKHAKHDDFQHFSRFQEISRICIEIPIEKIQIPENFEKKIQKMFSLILKFLFRMGPVPLEARWKSVSEYVHEVFRNVHGICVLWNRV